MAKGRPKSRMTAKIENFIRMEARGESRADIMHEIFGVWPDDPDQKKVHNLDCIMSRWRHRPDAQPIWDDEMRARVKRCVPKAVGRLENQVDDSNGWLANKAANDIFNLAKTTGIFQDEDKAITVRIDGMPEIGSPDQDES
jgi:hypothetical protein